LHSFADEILVFLCNFLVLHQEEGLPQILLVYVDVDSSKSPVLLLI
jgi:hypothetical protein